MTTLTEFIARVENDLNPHGIVAVMTLNHMHSKDLRPDIEKLVKLVRVLNAVCALIGVQDRKRGYPTGQEWEKLVEIAKETLEKCEEILNE